MGDPAFRENVEAQDKQLTNTRVTITNSDWIHLQ